MLREPVRGIRAALPPRFGDYFTWTVEVHNAVSRKLGKPEVTVEQAREVMLGTVAGQGHMGTTYPAKVLRGDLAPGFMIDLAHKDLGLALGGDECPLVADADDWPREWYLRLGFRTVGRSSAFARRPDSGSTTGGGTDDQQP